jgi:cation diffusion facilitator family transporter
MKAFEPTEDQKQALDSARRYEWYTLGALSTIIPLMAWAGSGSQSMKTAFLEDLLSLIPPIAYLVSHQFRQREPDRDYPYGYQRATLIAFLAASTALLMLGTFALYEATTTLLSGEHPVLGSRELFGHLVWNGWVMICVLIYSGILPVILGRKKHSLAKTLHDKTLMADSATNRADWMTAAAACLGILGIAFGYWWADAVAAILISLDIVRDGMTYLKGAVGDLMDRTPIDVDDEEKAHRMIGLLESELNSQFPGTEVAIRLRDCGLYLSGSVFLPADTDLDKLAKLQDTLDHLNPELHACKIVCDTP